MRKHPFAESVFALFAGRERASSQSSRKGRAMNGARVHDGSSKMRGFFVPQGGIRLTGSIVR